MDRSAMTRTAPVPVPLIALTLTVVAALAVHRHGRRSYARGYIEAIEYRYGARPESMKRLT